MTHSILALPASPLLLAFVWLMEININPCSNSIMKTPFKFLALISGAAVFSASTIFAVTTNPVGYITIVLNGESDTAIGLPIQQPSGYSGKIADVTGSVITFHSAPGWAADQFVNDGPNFLQINTGNDEGMVLAILSNDENSLTVDLAGEDLTGIVANPSDSSLSDGGNIIPFWTPSTLMPATLPAGCQIFLYDHSAGINKAASSILTYNGTNWFAGFSNANDFLIHPYESMVCRLPAESSDVTLIIAGTVPMVTHRFLMSNTGGQTDYRFYFNGPVELELGSSGLGFDAGDQLLVFNNQEDGINKAANAIITFNGSDWFNGFSNANTYELIPGRGYVYRRSANGSASVTWEKVPPYLQ
jgi:uncharacterized protein (TIGR02597 family)